MATTPTSTPMLIVPNSGTGESSNNNNNNKRTKPKKEKGKSKTNDNNGVGNGNGGIIDTDRSNSSNSADENGVEGERHLLSLEVSKLRYELQDYKQANDDLQISLSHLTRVVKERDNRIHELLSSHDVKDTHYPVKRKFPAPREEWQEDLEKTQSEVEQLYIINSYKKVPNPLLIPGQPPRESKKKRNFELTIDEFCARYGRLAANTDAVEAIKKAVLNLKGLLPDQVRGSKIVSINEINELLNIDGQRMCIILCGHESAGKTSMMECLIGRRLGFSDAGRATVCPVIYIFEYDEKCGEGYFKHGRSLQDAAISSPKALPDLPNFVKKHMLEIKQTKGISEEELFVKVVASSIQYAGIVVDCPGTLITTEGTDPKLKKTEDAFLDKVKKIISQQVAAANPQNSVILCMEYKSKVQSEGGCGAFYNAVLSKTPGFETFKSRVKLIFNRNDAECIGDLKQGHWIESFSRVDNQSGYKRTYDEIKNFFFNKPPSHDIFFTCMKNLDKLYDAHNGSDESEIAELRDALLENNSIALTALFKKNCPQLDTVFDAEYRFSFANLKRKIFDEIERSSEKFAKVALDQVSEFSDIISRNLNVVRTEADYDSRKDNATLVYAAWRDFVKQFSNLAEESLMNKTGIPLVDNHYDEDEFSQYYHSKFPLLLDFDWPNHFIRELDQQTLQRFCELHYIQLDFVAYGEMKEILNSHVDSFEVKTLNIAGAYQRMVDSMLCRLATVQFKWIREDQFYALINNDISGRGVANSPSQAAFAKALQVLEMFYYQFFNYFKTILIHFLEKCIDRAILNHNPTYVSRYRAPLATLRHLLCGAVRHWVNQGMEEFVKSLPDFNSSGDYITQHKYREFVEHVNDLDKINVESGLTDNQSKSLREKLLETVSKHTMVQFGTAKTHTVKEIGLTGEKPLEVALRAYAFHHAKMMRRFNEEWRYKKYYQIFGDNHHNTKRDHLKSIMEGFTNHCLVEMQYSSFEYPPTITDSYLHKNVTFVDHLGKEELETYLGSLYCITDDTARGSQTKAIVLEKLLKMLRGD